MRTDKSEITDAMASFYPLETGESDRDRLHILNDLYNPTSQALFLHYGLSRGMKVLEVGCGCGEFACWLASMVGDEGAVLAVDKDEKQLEIAQNLAAKRGITNIEFRQTDFEHLHVLNQQFDFVYARWVLMYLKNPSMGIRSMYQVLNKDGVLICEDIDNVHKSVFAFPESDVIDRWLSYWSENFGKLGLRINFFDDVFATFRKLEINNINVKINQPVLISEKEKSVLRLGMVATRRNILENNVTTAEMYDQFLQDAGEYEKTDSLIGFVRNILIAGRKSEGSK